MQSTWLLIHFYSVVELFCLHMDQLWLLTHATNWWASHLWVVESDRDNEFITRKNHGLQTILAMFSRNNFTNRFNHKYTFACQDSLTVKICTPCVSFTFSKTTTLRKKKNCMQMQNCCFILRCKSKKSMVRWWSTTATQSTVHLDMINTAVNNRNNGGFR